MIPRSKCKRLHGFEVEWCKNIPIINNADGSSDADMDGASYGHRDFDTLDLATEFAKEIAKTAEWHYAKIVEFEMRPISKRFPNFLEREYVGEETIVEHEA
jgi:hypothetical protein